MGSTHSPGLKFGISLPFLCIFQWSKGEKILRGGGVGLDELTWNAPYILWQWWLDPRYMVNPAGDGWADRSADEDGGAHRIGWLGSDGARGMWANWVHAHVPGITDARVPGGQGSEQL